MLFASYERKHRDLRSGSDKQPLSLISSVVVAAYVFMLLYGNLSRNSLMIDDSHSTIWCFWLFTIHPKIRKFRSELK